MFSVIFINNKTGVPLELLFDDLKPAEAVALLFENQVRIAPSNPIRVKSKYVETVLIPGMYCSVSISDLDETEKMMVLIGYRNHCIQQEINKKAQMTSLASAGGIMGQPPVPGGSRRQ